MKISRNEYQKILERVPIFCVDILIKVNNKILLLQRTNEPGKGGWWPPGGRLLKGESFEDCAKRKALEETGLRIKIKQKLGTYNNIFDTGPFKGLKTGVHTVSICYLVEPSDKKQTVKLDSQSAGYRWFDKSDQKLPGYIKKILKDSKII